MISRRSLFGLLVGVPAAAIVPRAHASIDWEEPEWDDSDRPEGGGVWDVKWYNRVRGIGFLKNKDSETVFVNNHTVQQSGIAFPEMRPGRSFIVRWQRISRGKTATDLQRV